ncbi:MAG: hypothetical protein IKP61_07065 [Spirochaetales bacterium]|nr:hypothetical protein [Spirochaetales bacterium]
MKRERTLINISKKTFVQVVLLLFALLFLSIILTYVIPRGTFPRDPETGEITDYSGYMSTEDRGIPLWKGLMAPVLVLTSNISLIMLALFLFVISASFQVMNDVGGIKAIVESVSGRFKSRPTLLLVLISLLFYCFGSFLGLFEEMLTMLPIITALCVMMGYDSFTGFICCILACGFGFAGAITNPFTVLLASQIIDVNPMVNIWFRIIIFIVMFGLLMAFLFQYLKRIRKNRYDSLTYIHDTIYKNEEEGQEQPEPTQEVQNPKLVRTLYSAFLLVSLAVIIISSLVSGLRDYTVVILTAYFLIFGLIAGSIAAGSFKKAGKSFLNGILGALPTLAFIALAASVKYVLEEGHVLDTLVNQINNQINGGNIILVALAIYLIVLVLEFFISSSTAKAILVMGILAMVFKSNPNLGLSKEMLVLLYTFGDGYTNVIFPTSPVLLISLSMIGVNYLSWVKKSSLLFLVNFLLVVAFIVLGVAIGY